MLIRDNTTNGDTGNINLYYDGSASFAGGNTEIASSGSISVNRLDDNTRGVFVGKFQGTDTTVIRANGSAEFGKVNIGFSGDPTNGDYILGFTGAGSDLGFGIQQQNVLGFYHGGSQVASIDLTGSATFAGAVEVGDDSLAGTIFKVKGTGTSEGNQYRKLWWFRHNI